MVWSVWYCESMRLALRLMKYMDSFLQMIHVFFGKICFPVTGSSLLIAVFSSFYFCLINVSIIEIIDMVALAVSAWTSDNLCYIFLKMCFSVHTDEDYEGKWCNEVVTISNHSFCLKVNFVANTVDIPAFFWLNFLCCVFFCPILHLREAKLEC